MKRKLIALSQQYLTALRKHIKPSQPDGLETARGLGYQAAAMGLETLDVARIHERALADLELSGSRDGSIKRAEAFFTEAITPIEKTHHAARKASHHLNQLNRTLSRRTVDVAAANCSLKRGIAERKAVEKALKRSGAHSERLLKESRGLQKHLQGLTHKILSTQEDKRKEVSRDLQDEIAQTLLGINVRLLTLKREASLSATSLKKEIASTQRLVKMSAETIEQFARDFRNHDET